jgi:hypothetical protein
MMNNDNSSSINGVPLPWEMGLYGNRTGNVGGYNFDVDGYRGVAVASCESKGQPMFLNYTASSTGRHLYHLVFIGEVGSGTINFLVKTRFGEAALLPVDSPTRVYPFSPLELAFASNSTELNEANLDYSTDNWKTSNSIQMTLSNNTCNATIPGQKAGTTVQYQVSADDVMKNSFHINGNFTVKQGPTLNLTVVQDRITLNENITILGQMNPQNLTLPISLQFDSGNVTERFDYTTFENGTLLASYRPKFTGTWEIRATIPESDTTYEFNSPYVEFIVVEPPFYIVYLPFIIGGVASAIGVFVAVYFLKFRNR